MNFKIGDRVKVKIAEGVEQYGKVIRYKANETMPNPPTDAIFVLFQNQNYSWVYDLASVSLITDPMDCLMVGDMVKDENVERTIQGVCGKLYWLSDFDLPVSLTQIKDDGFSLSQPNSTKIQEAYDLLVKEGKIVDGKIIK